VIRWCAYCQRFLGETSPFDQYDVTHGLCERCYKLRRFEDNELTDRMAPIRDLYMRIAGQTTDGPHSPAQLLEEGLAHGLAPVDLLMGMIQPALYSMGRAWSLGQASVVQEHILTAACSTLLTLLFERLPHLRELRQSHQPRVLLVNAEDNFHTLGLQVVELLLLSSGVPALAVLPGLPTREIAALVRSTRPTVLGVSVAVPQQFASVREIAGAVGELRPHHQPRVVTGGFAVKQGIALPDDAGLTLMANPHDLLGLVKT